MTRLTWFMWNEPPKNSGPPENSKFYYQAKHCCMFLISFNVTHIIQEKQFKNLCKLYYVNYIADRVLNSQPEIEGLSIGVSKTYIESPMYKILQIKRTIKLNSISEDFNPTSKMIFSIISKHSLMEPSCENIKYET